MCWARSRAFGRSTIKPIRVVVCDTMQQGYVYYRTEPPGRNFAPEFEPQLTPQDMLELGVFGGKYLTDCRSEFPAAWFRKAKLCAERHDPKLNYFGVNASQPLAVWRRNGWIHPHDPSPRSAKTAADAIFRVAAGSGKRCCTGHTTAVRFEPRAPSRATRNST